MKLNLNLSNRKSPKATRIELTQEQMDIASAIVDSILAQYNGEALFQASDFVIRALRAKTYKSAKEQLTELDDSTLNAVINLAMSLLGSNLLSACEMEVN